MITKKLAELFEKHNDRYLKGGTPGGRRDLRAFDLIEQLVPFGEGDILTHAEHDEVWLGVDLEELAKVITDEQVIELIECGVRYGDSSNSLAMFGYK